MRLRHELRAEGLAGRFEEAALHLQFSSLSSVGNDTKWLPNCVVKCCGLIDWDHRSFYLITKASVILIPLG